MLRRVITLLIQTRKGRGLSLDAVAAAVGTDPTNLSRVERGDQIPKRELARSIFEYYGGVVPLGAIYDPQYIAVDAHEPPKVTDLRGTVAELAERLRRETAAKTRASNAWKKARVQLRRAKARRV